MKNKGDKIMQNIYYFSEQSDPEKHAGYKARQDVESIVSKRYKPLYPYIYKNKNRIIQIKNLFTVLKKVKKNDYIFIQYPLVTFNKIANIILKTKKVILLVHDLNELRFGKTTTTEEKNVINNASIIISHNVKMTEYLIQQGVEENKIFDLNLFDYLADNNTEIDHSKDSNYICFAGNLEKSGFIYNLSENIIKLGINVYGINFNKDRANKNINYMGSFEPEIISSVIKGKFGLIWDGEQTTTCSGCMGNYMRYNNPHKLSMYIAAGMPVIVWAQSAVSQFVEKNNIGFSVDSLDEIPDRIKNISEANYLLYRKNVMKIRERIVKGDFLNQALNNVEIYINGKK